MSVLTYKPRKHEEMMLSLFGGAGCLASASDPSHPGPAIFFCFTNRCGSNFVSDCFVNAGVLKDCSEYFNDTNVVRRLKKQESATFPRFCYDLARSKSGPNGVFGSKLGWHQLYFLVRMGIIPQVFPNARFVFIRRNDLLGQAVSATIAFQTRRFRHNHAGNGKEAEYSFKAIMDQIRSIVISNSAFQQYFAVSGTPFHEIVYEDFAANPGAALGRACDWLGLPHGGLPLAEISEGIQRTDRNREFRERFLTDAAAQGIVGLEDQAILGRLAGTLFRR